MTAVDLSTNQSANSNEASATPQAAPPADGPTNLTASAFRQGTVKVDLAWTGGASSIDVYRQNPGASFTLIATTSNSGSYRDNLGTKAVSGTTYTYHVCTAGTTLLLWRSDRLGALRYVVGLGANGARSAEQDAARARRSAEPSSRSGRMAGSDWAGRFSSNAPERSSGRSSSPPMGPPTHWPSPPGS